MKKAAVTKVTGTWCIKKTTVTKGAIIIVSAESKDINIQQNV